MSWAEYYVWWFGVMLLISAVCFFIERGTRRGSRRA
jgi:hypothetical protein